MFFELVNKIVTTVEEIANEVNDEVNKEKNTGVIPCPYCNNKIPRKIKYGYSNEIDEYTCPNCHNRFLTKYGVVDRNLIPVHCISCGRDVWVPGHQCIETKCDYCGAVFYSDKGRISRENPTIKNSAASSIQQSSNSKNDAIENLVRLAGQGDREAQFNLAMKYRNGTNVPKDYAKAFSLMEQSAKQNYESAQYWLSIFYKDGIGTEPNETLSIEWLKRAADNGNSAAKDSLKNRIRDYDTNDNTSTKIPSHNG